MHCSALTYHEAVDWLESKGVKVWSDFVSGFWYGIIATNECKSAFYDKDYYTREGALNYAILKALEGLQ